MGVVAAAGAAVTDRTNGDVVALGDAGQKGYPGQDVEQFPRIYAGTF